MPKKPPGEELGTAAGQGSTSARGRVRPPYSPPLLGPRAPFFGERPAQRRGPSTFPGIEAPGQRVGEPKPAVESVGTPRWGARGRQGGCRREKERFACLFLHQEASPTAVRNHDVLCGKSRILELLRELSLGFAEFGPWPSPVAEFQRFRVCSLFFGEWLYNVNVFQRPQLTMALVATPHVSTKNCPLGGFEGWR